MTARKHCLKLVWVSSVACYTYYDYNMYNVFFYDDVITLYNLHIVV